MKIRILSFLTACALMAGAVPSAAALAGEAQRCADTLVTLGLLEKSGDVTADATRAEAAELLVALSGGDPTGQDSGWSAGFRDVPAAMAPAVNYAAHQGWVTGVTQADFCPGQAVTANAWCTMLLRMLGYQDALGDFSPGQAALFAQHMGLTPLRYQGTLSRGQLYEIACSALTFSPKGSAQALIEVLVGQGRVRQGTANALGLLRREMTVQQAAQRCMSAVFCVDTYPSPTYWEIEMPTAHGSGFFISSDGLAVTNYHVIADAYTAIVRLSTGEWYPVQRVLFADEDLDLAVLQVSPVSGEGVKTSGFSFLTLAGTEDLRAGDTVYALGNPLDLGLAVSQGVVSNPALSTERYTLPCVLNTADTSEGSSGGALLNVYGQVVAVTTGSFTYGNGMYVAVPVDPVMEADLSGPGTTLQAMYEQRELAG